MSENLKTIRRLTLLENGKINDKIDDMFSKATNTLDSLKESLEQSETGVITELQSQNANLQSRVNRQFDEILQLTERNNFHQIEGFELRNKVKFLEIRNRTLYTRLADKEKIIEDKQVRIRTN